jgi:hypothetical protein
MAGRRKTTRAPDPAPDAWAAVAAAQMTTGGVATVSDDTTVTEPQAGAETEPQAGIEHEAQAAAPTSQAEAGDEKPSTDEAKQARAEAAKYRRQLRELEAKLKAKEDADLSEAERQARELTALKEAVAAKDEQTRTLALEAAIAVRASRMGIVDPDAAMRLLDRGHIEFTEDGRPDGASVEGALKDLLKAKPYLRASAPPPGSAANPARQEPKGETDAQRRARLFGGGAPAMFDPQIAERSGGGVIFPSE